MIRVWILELTWRLEQQAKVIAQVEELVNSDMGASMPEDDLKILRGQILMIRSQQLYFYNQTTQVIEITREALALLPSNVDIRPRCCDVMARSSHAIQRPVSRGREAAPR